MFPILSTLPGIHATIVGIGLAFFSTFFMYAYQKITDAQKRLDKALKLAVSVSSPHSATMHMKYYSSLLRNDGELDWSGRCQMLLHEAHSIFPYSGNTRLDSELPQFLQQPENQKIFDTVEELTTFFYLFFTHYPMNGKPLIITSATHTESQKEEKFDLKRYQEIQNRISHLSWYLKTFKKSFFRLFEVYDKIHMFHAENNEGDNKQPKNATHLLIDFYEKINIYENQVMPILNETISEFDSYNNELKIKNTTKNSLKITLYIITIGILIPLIMLEIISGIENSRILFIVSYLEYFILIASFLPYFLLCLYFLNKIDKTIFK